MPTLPAVHNPDLEGGWGALAVEEALAAAVVVGEEAVVRDEQWIFVSRQ
jgi:hypothetical protein